MDIPYSEDKTTRVTKVAVVQASPVCFNLIETLKKLEKLCKEAADAGAKFVVFPEAFLSAYPKGSFFVNKADYYGNRSMVKK